MIITRIYFTASALILWCPVTQSCDKKSAQTKSHAFINPSYIHIINHFDSSLSAGMERYEFAMELLGVWRRERFADSAAPTVEARCAYVQ